jgi:hypothetical protein
VTPNARQWTLRSRFFGDASRLLQGRSWRSRIEAIHRAGREIDVLPQRAAWTVRRIEGQGLLERAIGFNALAGRELGFGVAIEQLDVRRAAFQGKGKAIAGIIVAAQGYEGEALQIEHLLRLFERSVGFAQSHERGQRALRFVERAIEFRRSEQGIAVVAAKFEGAMIIGKRTIGIALRLENPAPQRPGPRLRRVLIEHLIRHPACVVEAAHRELHFAGADGELRVVRRLEQRFYNLLQRLFSIAALPERFGILPAGVEILWARFYGIAEQRFRARKVAALHRAESALRKLPRFGDGFGDRFARAKYLAAALRRERAERDRNADGESPSASAKAAASGCERWHECGRALKRETRTRCAKMAANDSVFPMLTQRRPGQNGGAFRRLTGCVG